MEDILYYPLVGMDTEGVEKQPMFPTKDRLSVTSHHDLWLTEMVPDHFRLGANEKPSVGDASALRVHCPRCGKILRTVSVITEEHPFPLYACDECSPRR